MSTKLNCQTILKIIEIVDAEMLEGIKHHFFARHVVRGEVLQQAMGKKIIKIFSEKYQIGFDIDKNYGRKTTIIM